MDVYAENILDHYRHPRGKEPLENATVRHEELNASCGDALTLELHIAGGVIDGIGWQGTGCAISQASMSMLAEELAGKSLEEAGQITPEDIYSLLGVPISPRRMQCALLALHALRNALHATDGNAAQG